ncbi:hypothetical protein KY285_026320 [Solanum tuberosum]|nr:hypothetical protein KY285_026320 [Solanum tuberosum]
MASKNFVQPVIPRFDGHYDHWSMLMENFLRSKEFWPVVSIGVQEPTTGYFQTNMGFHKEEVSRNNEGKMSEASSTPWNRGGRSNFAETKEDGETKEEEEEVSLLMAYTSNEIVSTHLWYLDTNCSNHMCGQKEAFSELDESFQDTVRFGDNSMVSAMGKGKVEFVRYDILVLGSERSCLEVAFSLWAFKFCELEVLKAKPIGVGSSKA